MGLKDTPDQHSHSYSNAKHSGKFDPMEAASQATDDYDYDDDYEEDDTSSKRKKSKHKSRKAFTVIVILFILIICGVGGYWFLVWHKNSQKSQRTAANAQASKSSIPALKISAKTKHYVSTDFALEFDYPEDWTVQTTAGSGQLTVTSLPMGLKAVAGNSFTGQVVLTFLNKQQPLPEFDKGNALAVRESEKITYTKPSSAQRGSTYLSFLNYASSADTNQLDGVFITGDVGYKVGQAIPKADFVPIDPVISLTFLKCSDNTCSGTGVQTGLAPTIWDDPQFGTPLKSMLQSLTIN